MPLYKREKSPIWWVDITTPSGERIRCSAKTKIKKQAQEYHDKLKAQLWDQEVLNKEQERYFDEALLLFLRDSEQQKRLDSKKSHAQYFRQIFGGRTLSSLTTEELISAIPIYSADGKKKLTPATQNRYRSSILRMLSLAYKAGWLDKIPYIPRKQEPKVRVSWINKEQAKAFVEALSLDWMQDVCTFALLTGARMSEILTMTWEKIDFEKQIAIVTNDKAKSGKARSLPLNKDAIVLLRRLYRQNSEQAHVFIRTSTKKPINDIDRRDFQQAADKINASHLHFHDLRHTWASWHVQAGTPLFTLKEMGGWETLEMVRKYAHLNADHIIEHANSVTFTSQ